VLVANGYELKGMTVSTSTDRENAAVFNSGAFWLQKGNSAYFCLANSPALRGITSAALYVAHATCEPIAK
jgi:hypothetical protein